MVGVSHHARNRNSPLNWTYSLNATWKLVRRWLREGIMIADHCTMEDLSSWTVLAACRLIVQVLLLYLYHTKAMPWVLGKPHALPQVPALNLGSIFVLLEFASTISSRWLPFFNLRQGWMLTKSSEEVSDQTALFKVCFISTIFRCFHASMWF